MDKHSFYNISCISQSWKNKLLDLGKRNKLLNYKESASSTLKITYPNYYDLYERFVKNETDLVFPRELGEWAYSSDYNRDDESIEDTNIEKDYGGYGSSIRTNRKVKDLQRVLRKLRNKAKVANEEQGINILYLSFGFLKYTEIDHSNLTYLAPLVLVPVCLTVESITSPYTLKLHEEAILLAKKGVSFVLQGPPGTGKSQTITNIIAECLANDKKVLFVSEKMAALEVVHHRITLAGLDDFCLVLHSQKANKRGVLDQLETVLRLADKKATMSSTAFIDRYQGNVFGFINIVIIIAVILVDKLFNTVFDFSCLIIIAEANFNQFTYIIRIPVKCHFFISFSFLFCLSARRSRHGLN